MNDAQPTTHFLRALPAQMNVTIGRSQQIATAGALLRREDVRLLTLIGPGGVGKTRLALEIARSLHTSFQDGVVLVSLAPLRDASLVLLAIAQALDVSSTSQHSLSDLLAAYLREKQLLLVLDNFEHVLEASAPVAELLIAAPQVKLLVTSREVLHLYGEHEFEVPPLDLPDPQQSLADPTSPLPTSLALFVERAQAVQPDFLLTSANLPYVAEICVQLDGLPLAIELAAARCKLLSPQLLLERLQKRLHILTGGARNLPIRHQTLRNTLDWSYHLLTAEEQRFFYCLGVFTGTWTIEAASAVAARADEDGDALALLSSLVDKSLVRLHAEADGEVRFQLLETIREYALDWLEKRGEVIETQLRYALFYTELAEQAEPHLISRDQHSWLLKLDRESANFWQVMRWVIEHKEVELGLRLAGALIIFFELRSSFGEVRNRLEQILQLEEPDEPTILRAKVAYGAGMLAIKQNHLTQARQHLEMSRRYALQLDDKRVLALSLGMLSLVELEQGNYEQAYMLARNGLRVLEQTKDIWTRGIVHGICGVAACRKCDFTHALVHYKLSLALLRQVGDVHSEADCLVNVANMMRQRGKLITAHFLYQKAFALYQQINDRWGLVICWHGIGDVLCFQGDFLAARENFTSCLSLAITLGSGGMRISALYNLGLCALYQHDIPQATQHFKECLHLSRELEYLLGVALSLQGLAEVALVRGTLEVAKDYYEQSLHIVRDMDDKVYIVNNLCGLGRVALARKAYEQSNTCFRQALQMAREAGDMLGLATSLGVFARLCGCIRLYERAAQFLGSADALRQSLQASRTVIYHTEYEQDVSSIQANIGKEAFHENWMVGQTMTLNHTLGMIAQIHVADPAATETPKSIAHYPAGLTSREVDVLRLVAQGLTDVGIAKQLVLSPRTVNTHLRSIYAKLGISSRSAATRFAVESHLL